MSKSVDSSLMLMHATTAELLRLVTPHLRNPRSFPILHEIIHDVQMDFDRTTYAGHSTTYAAAKILEGETTRRSIKKFDAYVASNFTFFDRLLNHRELRADRKALADFNHAAGIVLEIHQLL